MVEPNGYLKLWYWQIPYWDILDAEVPYRKYIVDLKDKEQIIITNILDSLKESDIMWTIFHEMMKRYAKPPITP